MSAITRQQWEFYDHQGYLRLGKVLGDDELATLQQRIDDIMLGSADIDYDRILMQRDGSGDQSKGFKGAALTYRKIQDLEHDPRFLDYMKRPIFRDVCMRVYGDIPISCFRAMFMNKPAKLGTYLSWHQDRWTSLDRDPLVTVWTALDAATVANGCLQIIPQSHLHGLINPGDPSGFLTETQAAQYCPKKEALYLELQPGEVVLLHNWLLHASDVNQTATPRRAFSVCYMDARTTNYKDSHGYSVIFGDGALPPDTFSSSSE
jgi:hypothetical protein